MTKYTHLKLDNDVENVGGFYTPQEEVRLKYNDREVLYIVGQTTRFPSSRCGFSSWEYVLVPGYILNWHNETNEEGLPVSEVEPIPDEVSRNNITKIIEKAESVPEIEFW